MSSVADVRGGLRAAGYLAAAQVRSDWQYRSAFLLAFAVQAIVALANVVAILIVLELTPSLGGWSRGQVLLAYSLVGLTFGLADALFSALEDTGEMTRTGDMDRVLLRPVGSIAQIVGRNFQLRRIGKIVPPIVAFVWAVPRVDIDWGLWTVGYLMVTVVSATAIFAGLWVVSGAVGFVAVGVRRFSHSITYGGQQASEYPLHLYPRWVRLVYGWVVPLAFVAYLPVIVLTAAPNPLGIPRWLGYCAPLVALALCGAARLAWGAGTRRYQSTGR